MIWIGFKRAEFFLQKKMKKMLASGMCFDEADVQRSSTFVLYAPKQGDLFKKFFFKNQAGWIAVLRMYPT